MTVFVGEDQVDLKALDLTSKQEHTIELCNMKRYACRYNGKNRKIDLVYEKSINYNKSLIFSELIKRGDVEYN